MLGFYFSLIRFPLTLIFVVSLHFYIQTTCDMTSSHLKTFKHIKYFTLYLASEQVTLVLNTTDALEIHTGCGLQLHTEYLHLYVSLNWVDLLWWSDPVWKPNLTLIKQNETYFHQRCESLGWISQYNMGKGTLGLIHILGIHERYLKFKNCVSFSTKFTRAPFVKHVNIYFKVCSTRICCYLQLVYLNRIVLVRSYLKIAYYCSC